MSWLTALALAAFASILMYGLSRALGVVADVVLQLGSQLETQNELVAQLHAETQQLWAQQKGNVWVPPAPEPEPPVELPDEVLEAISAIEGDDAQREYEETARHLRAAHPNAAPETLVTQLFS